MGSFFLSKRNNKKDNSIRLYAVSQIWDAEKGKQIKDKQIYLGCKRADGTFNFNAKAETYLNLLQGTEFEKPFFHWKDYKEEQQAFAAEKTKKTSNENSDETSGVQTQAQRSEEEKVTVLLRLSPATIEKAKLLGKEYTGILERLLDLAVNDPETVKKCL